MGKIVKFCSSCDEGFAEKFGFCPNCGQSLQTFEMSPIVPEAPVVEKVAAAPAVAATIIEPVETPVEVVNAAPVEEFVEAPVIDEPVIAQPVEVPVVAAPTPKAAAATVAPFIQKTVVDADAKRGTSDGWVNVSSDDGGFHITQIEEKNVGTRRALLLGSFGFMLFVLMSAMVYNLFSKDLEVGSINDDIFNAVMVEDIPTDVEELKEKKNKDDGGGGGGGGREEKEEVTKGDLADQTPKPIRPPDAKVPRLDHPELVLPPPSTEGNRKFPKENDRYGDPNGRFTSFSNGTGSGGGQGSGIGTGQGSGRGTGAGSGTGSGSGGGLGSGNGNGRGVGDNGDDGNPPPPIKVGVTQGLKILSKPRPGYTDAARTANVQGTVILRVTFLSSGQVGSVSVIKGLPNGLSEQAISAAKRIAFEPAKTNGQGQTVTKQIEYSFSIY
ncbi:MAG: energy transducer TonB [Pyrinomonadaceae bacterium]